MEEDIIYGKKRHLFGGLEPSNMLSFEARKINGSVYLNVVLPKDTEIDGQLLVTVAGAIIRKSETDYPKDEFDGELVADVSEDGLYLDETNTRDRVWYYAAFPYSDQGVYNRSDTNRTLCEPFNYIYGYDIDLNDSDPATRVRYPDDVDNSGDFKPAYMDYTSGVFNYGDWTIDPGYDFMPKPCMLTDAGIVDHYLDPNNYSLMEDGVTPSRVSDLTFNGNAMMEWPKIYTKRWEENGVYHFRCSSTKIDEDYECWCNYDKSQTVKDHFYTSIYPMTTSIHRSISGYAPYSNTSYNELKSYMSTLSSGWSLDIITHRLLIQDLLVMMAKNTDTQTSYGYGYATNDTNSPMSGGSLNKKGLFWGSNSYINSVKVFGMEHWWNNLSRFNEGSIVDNAGNLKLFNPKTGEYTNNVRPDSQRIGYIKSCMLYNIGRLPSDIGGSGSTFECDYFYMRGVTGLFYYPTCGRSIDTSQYTTASGAFAIDFSITNDGTIHKYLGSGLTFI